MKNFYVYSYIDPRDNNIFYIGKGKNKRYQVSLNEAIGGKSHNQNLIDAVRDIRSENLEPIITILYENLSERAALMIEAYLINQYGLNNLCNKINGFYAQLLDEIENLSISDIESIYL